MRKYKFISEHRGIFRVVEYQTVWAVDYDAAFQSLEYRNLFTLFTIDK